MKHSIYCHFFWLPGFLLALSPLLIGAADAPSKQWSGTWDNKKYKTSGPLTCSAKMNTNGVWQAKFTGTGLGKPFGYDATIRAGEKGGRLILQGTTSVDGEAYQWSGYVQGKVLVGSYKSASGNNGTFKLQER